MMCVALSGHIRFARNVLLEKYYHNDRSRVHYICLVAMVLWIGRQHRS